MDKISRRTLIKTTAAGLVYGATPLVWRAALAQGRPSVRYEASTPQGQAMLQKYARAVSIMKNRGMGDPLSWTFAWYTHWVRGDSTKAQQIAQLPAAQRSLANDMWNTCQNHGGFTTEDMFLPWHRMYVYFFERIVRGTLGDQSFTLPYWNYNNNATAALPRPFIAPAIPGNSLWTASRNPGPNRGDKLTNLNLNALRQAQYSAFCSTLDNGLHGQVHVAVGNTVGMGSVPWAANDPIFWMHHCNIDRLWASWNAAGRTNPTTPSWLGQQFTFARESGAKVVATVRDFTRIDTLGYAYDRLEPVPRAAAPTKLLGQGIALLQKSAGSLTLGSEPTRVELAAVTTQKSATLGARLQALGGDRRIYLTLDDLMTNAAPGVNYDVYLNLPDPALPDPSPFYAGTINFFTALMLAGAKTMAAPSIALDVTELARSLQANGALDGGLTVTIVPAGSTDSAAQPVIGSIALVED